MEVRQGKEEIEALDRLEETDTRSVMNGSTKSEGPALDVLSPEELHTLESIQRRILWLSANIVNEANHVRRITGSLGQFSVDMTFGENGMTGEVEPCTYHMRTASDSGGTLYEQVRAQGYDVTIRIAGYAELLRLPAADQAALLPLLVRCSTAKMFENYGQDPPTLAFGGPLGAQPPNTLSFGQETNNFGRALTTCKL